MIRAINALFRQVEHSRMKRVSQIDIYYLGVVKRILDMRAGDEKTKHAASFDRVLINLRGFYLNDINRELLPNAVVRAANLYEILFILWNGGKPGVILDSEAERLEGLLRSFEASLEDELDALPTYIIERIGAYSSEQLISHADNAFPSSMRDDIPKSVIEDFRKAGACLSFDLPTACGFHSFRAADAMIRMYYAHFVNVVPKKKPRDWGTYVRVLRLVLNDPSAPRKPNERTVNLLDSIRSFDRNPVIHPELDLDAETALVAFDMCKNVIVLMALDIEATP
jgi:hypothetical protein